MRCVDRGSEPAGVDEYRRRYTQGWVDHFQSGMGQRSPDLANHWRDFRDELGARFNGKCGYCERACDAVPDNIGIAPTLDHFRPINRFPELAYEWTNWVFSCRRCNDFKGGKWPESGYIDPCPADLADCPEEYLDVDADTGSLLPKSTLASSDKAKAQYTIDDIGLNQLDMLIYRLRWIRDFRADLGQMPTRADRQALIDFFTAPNQEFAGVVSMVANQMRLAGEI